MNITGQNAKMQDWIETLEAYQNQGRPTGDCARALLSNDLFGFIKRADNETLENFLNIARYVWNHMDMRCWGSPEKVDAWLKKKREEREKMTAPGA